LGACAPQVTQILSVLRLIKAPALFVVVAGGSPGSLISLLTLAIPVQEAFLLVGYHKYVKPSRYCVSPWHQSIEFEGPKACDGAAIYVVSDKPNFLHHVLTALNGIKWLILTINVERCGVSHTLLSWAVADGHRLCQEFGLRPLVVGNAATEGITDAHHLLGFEDDLSSPCIPFVEAGLHRTVGHILDGGVKGSFPTVTKSSLPALITPP
jgi:hypothetical protein